MVQLPAAPAAKETWDRLRLRLSPPADERPSDLLRLSGPRGGARRWEQGGPAQHCLTAAVTVSWSHQEAGAAHFGSASLVNSCQRQRCVVSHVNVTLLVFLAGQSEPQFSLQHRRKPNWVDLIS